MKQLPCSECEEAFTIFERDVEFYQRLEVPEPKKCPQCRFRQRLVFRNERNLYQRTCDACQKTILSIYSQDKLYTVYCRECWWSDTWNALDYGQDIDFTRPFFEQVHEVRLRTPRITLLNDADSENSDYTNHVYRLKNCYMVFDACDNEGSLYCTGIYNTKDNVDSAYNDRTELCYETEYCIDCYDLSYSRDCVNSRNSAFLIDCVGVANSFMCVGLRNKSYCFKNQQYTEEEYNTKLAAYNMKSYASVQNYKQEFEEFALTVPRKYFHGLRNEATDGDYIVNNNNVHYSFQTRESENCSYSYGIHHAKDSYDYTIWGEDATELYEAHACGGQAYRLWFCNIVWHGQENYYSDNCLNGAEYCFGCVGLKKQKYCILNKQYSEQDFFTMRDRLIKHMRETDEWGNFFPKELSPFGYNETMANEFFPLTKEQATERGYSWQDNLPGTFGKETVSTIPDVITDTTPQLCNEVLQCVNCFKNYKVVEHEYAFYARQSIPIPQYCPNCRHLNRIRNRSPYAMSHRQCMCVQQSHDHTNQCETTFDTVYAPERKEIVYCENCYHKEVY